MQKALDDLVRHYIISETRYEKAEKEDGPLEDNINQETFEDEYIKALYDCLESKGVVRELQTFLRQRLVAILQEKWPNLGGQEELVSFSPVAIRLVQDFLCSHQLLYTFSVLASEIGQMFSLKQPFGKLPFPEAERILDQMDIRKVGSRERILQCYLEKDRFSLLECIISICPWAFESDGLLRQKDFLVCNERRVKQFSKPLVENSLHLRKTLDGTKKNVNEESKVRSGDKGVKERLRILEESMQNEHESYTQALSKYKEEDTKRIHDEIETRLKFEMLNKEKELLQNYEEKATSMRKALDRERELWLSQKDREENDIFQHKERIILLMNSLTEKEQIIKSMLENYQIQCTAETNEFEKKERSYQLKEAELSSTIQKLREENKILKKMQSMTREDLVVHDFKSQEKTTFTNNKVITIGSPSPICETNNDTIAFLKYSLECQAEEIKLLRSSFANSQSQSMHQERMGLTNKNIDYVKQSESKDVREKHLEQFIKDSKRRCDEIEKEAKEIEYTLESFKNRSMEKCRAISKSSVISPQGTLNLLPCVPKINYSLIPSLLTSTELPNPMDQTRYFSNMLNQMFPSRDFNLPRTKQHTQLEANNSNQTEMIRPQTGTYESVKEKFKSATIDAEMISQFQENLSDLKKLVNTSIISPTPYKGVLNAILENGEAPNINSVQIIDSPGQSNSLTDSRLPKNIASYPPNLPTPENSITEYAGGDAKISTTHDKAKNKNGIPSENTNRSENSTSMKEKASESGALVKAKVPSPPRDDQNGDRTDRSETSISIRSVMKTKINFGANHLSQSQLKPSRPEYDDGDPNYVTEDELEDDVSISAPDISQSQAEDFWNV